MDVDAAEELAADLTCALSSDERERAMRAREPRDRRRRAMRWACRREIISEYVDGPATALEFRHEAAGRAVLDSPTELTFSAAHADGISLLAVGRDRAVGIDLEPLSAASRIAEVADGYLPRDRVRRVRAVEPSGREEEWVSLWTELEACAKLDGSGLGDLDATRADTLLSHADARVQFRPQAGFVATLVYQGDTARLSCFVFDPRARARTSMPAVT